MNTNSNIVSNYKPVVKVQDKINLARSRGEYTPKASRNKKLCLALQSPKVRQTERSLEDMMLFA